MPWANGPRSKMNGSATLKAEEHFEQLATWQETLRVSRAGAGWWTVPPDESTGADFSVFLFWGIWLWVKTNVISFLG